MYVLGHVGASLLLYAPAGALVRWSLGPELAVWGLVATVVLSTLPDIDQHLPIEHRGPTHTVWFVLVVSVVCGVAGLLVAPAGQRGISGLVVGTAAALSLLSHLLADSITPMGVAPFVPLSSFEHSFGIVYAANTRANVALFVVGFLCTGFVHVGLWWV